MSPSFWTQPFPEVIDSSMMSAWRSCRRKGALEYIEHWRGKDLSVHLHAGKSFAEGLEVARTAFFLEGRTEQESIAIGMGALLRAYGDFECPQDSAKSVTRMAGAFEYYFSQYPMAADKAVPVSFPGGGKGIEFGFVEPIDVIHPTTGQPLLYTGRLDMICEYAGQIFGEDDKTTSQLGASWSKQWDLRSQFTAYCWGAGKSGFPLAGFLIRGISILKTKYETQQAITYRPQWMIDQWYEALCRDLEDMKAAWQEGYFRPAFDFACNEYGGCQFRKVCLSQDAGKWLAVDFERRRWDPVTRTESVIEMET